MIMELLAELRALIARHAGGEAARQALPDIVLASFSEPTLPLGYVGDPIFALVAQGAKRAVLGVGTMGQPMAGKLLDGGHSLIVFDINEAAMEPLLLRPARTH